MSYQSSYEYMPLTPQPPFIPICKVCSALKDPHVPKLACSHYICRDCYVEMKSLQKNNCVLCHRKMQIRCPRY